MRADAPRILVGTAGHIDHGKSSLVKALTGTDPDPLPEEKERGITIDLGFAHTTWEGVTFSFVDVPGHERFVKTMVAGAYGVDVALLVVAANDAVMPQTREHTAILRLLGLSAGVIARTKSDLVDDEEGQLVDDEVRELARGTFLEGAPVVAVSTVTGRGLDELRRALVEASRRAPERALTRPVRLAVDRAFTMKGFGPVVTGTLEGGRLRVEDRLTLLPEGLEVRVRRVEVHGEERSEAVAGERTSLNLAGVARADLRRGQVLVAPGSRHLSTLLTVELSLLASVKEPLQDGTRLRLHHLTSDVPARLTLVPERPTGTAPVLRPGGRAFAQLQLEDPVAAQPGDRFILRRPSPVETLGGGRVLDPARPRLRRRDTERGFLDVLASGDGSALAGLFLREAGPRGLAPAELAPRLAVPVAEAASLLDALAAAGQALRLRDALYVSRAASDDLASRVSGILAARKTAASAEMPRGELLEQISRGLPEGVAEAWLAHLVAVGKLFASGDRVGPPGPQAKVLTGPIATVATAYERGGFDAPRSADLAKPLGLREVEVDRLVSQLIKDAVLVRLSPEVVVHRAAVDSAAERLAVVKGRTLPVSAFRDLFGLSRKTLIPLLEHFDQKKRTRRAGDLRLVL